MALIGILVLLITGGCEGQPTAGPAESAGESIRPPVSQPLLDIGQVSMLYGGDTGTLLDNDIKRQDVILEAVCQKLLADRNVKMSIRAVFDMEPEKQLQKMLTANDPPSICLRLPKVYGRKDEQGGGVSALPLALNDTIEAYGQHLQSSLPQNAWDAVSVKGAIYAIPTVRRETAVVAANKKMMDQYGWQLPATLELFEQLLDTAARTDEGIVPVAVLLNFDTSQNWFDIAESDAIETQDGWISGLTSERYLDWQSHVRKWVENRWVKQTMRPQPDGSVSPGTSKWLFCEMRLSEVADTPDVVVLPPITAVPGAPRRYGLYFPSWSFESYRNPEALVVLMDWMITSEQNNRLLAVGIENEDYRMVSDTEYEWIDGPPWPGYSYFPISGLFSEPSFRHVNAQAYRDALALYESYPVHYSKHPLPQEAYSYRLENSRLDVALKRLSEYSIAVGGASTDYIWGRIDINEYNTIAAENQHLLQPYIDLIEDVRTGRYDVNEDIFNPFVKAR